jgi:hypothetical protein
MPPRTSARVRTVFDRLSCTVYSYPSSGGTILKRSVGVELEYLNFSRTKVALCDEDAVEDDAFALRMLQLGAHWWPSLKFYHRNHEQQ